MRLEGAWGRRHEPALRIGRVDGESPGVAALSPGIRPVPAAPAVAAPGGAVAAGLVGPSWSARMPRQAVHVAGCLWSVIAERAAAVFGAHQPTQLDSHQHHLAIVRARCDPAHVRSPRPGRKAPVRPRRDLLKRHQLLPALAAVTAAKQPARLRARVHGAVRRAHRDAEHVGLRQRQLLEAVAAVSAALQPTSPTADVHRVAVERQAVRPGTLQTCVRTDADERVPGRRKQFHAHRIARHARACAPEDLSARRGHTRQGSPKYARVYWDELMQGVMGESMSKPFDLVLGRKTYEIFAAFWPDSDDPAAEPLNEATKHVASTSVKELGWENSKLIEGEVPEGIRALKEEDGPELQVHGSANLIQTLLEHGLIDEFRVWTFPLVLGTGKRLFDGGTVPAGLELTSSQASSTGVIIATYRSGAEIKYGSFAE